MDNNFTDDQRLTALEGKVRRFQADEDTNQDGERIAILETKFETLQGDLTHIKQQLDELLHLKSKGMGALWLVSLIIGSGMLGLILTLVNFFSKSHV